MYAVDYDIGACIFRGNRHVLFKEFKMGAVRLVYNKHFTVSVYHFRNGGNIAAHSVIVGAGQYYSGGFRVLRKAFFNFFAGDFPRNPVFGDQLGIGIDWPNSSQCQRVEHGFVAVSCHDQLPAGRHGGQDGSNNASASAVDQQVGM